MYMYIHCMYSINVSMLQEKSYTVHLCLVQDSYNMYAGHYLKYLHTYIYNVHFYSTHKVWIVIISTVKIAQSLWIVSSVHPFRLFFCRAWLGPLTILSVKVELHCLSGGLGSFDDHGS